VFEPEQSPVYSGGEQAEHKIIGIGPGFVTDNFRRSKELLDEIILVSDETAYKWTKKIAKQEGILVGPSSGAGAYVADLVSQRPEYENKILVFLVCDTGERYLSTPGLFGIDDVEIIP